MKYIYIMFDDYKMNANFATKLNLLNYIKSFSMPDFPDLKILSKSFFNNLFLKSYQNDSIYTLLYGDIDGLRKLNDNIGFDKADLAIKELLKTVLNYLPENAISSRVGGDEFCFIIPDLQADDIEKLTKQIHQSLSSSESVMGLNITLSGCDSTKFDKISDMYTFAENKVNLKKHSALRFDEPVRDIDDYNKKLDELIDYTLKAYIKNFRFSPKRYFKQEDLKILSYPIVNTIVNLLHSDKVNNANIQETLFDTNLQVNFDTIKKIYNLIINNTINYADLDSLSIKDLMLIRNNLSLDSVTGTHNNVYRDYYLIPHFKEAGISFKIILLKSLGIKILNSISSHTDTDLKIKSTFDCLINDLNAIIPEVSNIKLFPIHSGGGNFEIFVQNDASKIITPDTIDSILTNINLNKNNIQLFGTVGECIDILDYNSVYSRLDSICEEKKNKIKNNHNYFISPDALKLLDISLSSVVDFFEVQSKQFGIYNEHTKKEFSQKIINALIDNFHELNLSNNLYEENESDYSR